MTLAALTHGVDPPRVHHTLLRQSQDVGVPDADIDNEGFPFNELFKDCRGGVAILLTQTNGTKARPNGIKWDKNG